MLKFSPFKTFHVAFLTLAVLLSIVLSPRFAVADSVNSPNVTMNVDTNRATATGPGAGNVSITINTITIAETMLPEYSAGAGKAITLKARPGFQFDSSSIVTAVSATFGINGAALNVAASLTPTGAENESLTFNLTSASASIATTQDIIRINGIKLKILSAAGAAGPAQTTLTLTTSTAGGAFTNQEIVAANISKGAPDHLVFSLQPGSVQAAADLLPQVKIVDFGGNIITNDSRDVTLALQSNPGSATLDGTTQRTTANGVATWVDADDLNVTVAAGGYTLRASHGGAPFFASDTVDSEPFTISAGSPGGLSFSVQPVNTSAGGDILLSVSVVDNLSNVITSPDFEITLDSAVNPGGWPLLTDSSLTKTTTSGVATWDITDHLRITKAITNYALSASGVGTPITSNSFDINPGSANALRFLQQPSTVNEDTAMNPAPTAEIIDAFGNRVSSTDTVTITAPLCNAGLSGNTAAADAGLAIFNALTIDTACDDAILVASLSSSLVAGGTSSAFDVKASDSIPIALKTATLKKGKQFTFKASGSFKISTKAIDDPTKKGAVLTVTGTTGKVKYSLPKSGWRKTGKSGFVFAGGKCQSVTLQKNSINAICNGRTGTISLPETTLGIVLAVGKGTETFCGECGGTSKADETKTFKRTACAKPSFCP